VEEPEDTPVPEPTATEEPAEQVLRIAFDASDLSSLDPHFAAATQDRAIVDMVFNGLIRYKPGDIAEFEPDLAQAIPDPTTEDGKQVWTFELRQGVMCHPWNGSEGYELTSEDVIYSLEKAANADRSAYAGEYTGMTFEAPDDYTVRVILDEPLSPALFLPKVTDYAGGFVVCKQAVEDMGDEGFKTHPVGTGPFMFENYNPMENVTLAANDQYFRSAPKLTKVEAHYIPDISSRELGLREGELDLAEGLREQPWIEKMMGAEGVTVDVFGPGETVVLHMNQSVESLADVNVRKAIAYALAREDFLAFFGEDTADPLYSPVPVEFLAGGLTMEEVVAADVLYETDRTQAEELLAEAGAEDLELTSNTSERASYRRTYEAIQDQLKQVGITLNLEVVDHSTMHSLIREDANPLVVYIAWRPNADVFLTRFYHSDSIVVTGAKPDTNFSHYTEIDDLIEQARGETDPDAQAELWKQAQIKIMEDAAAYPLFILKFVFGRAEYVDYGYDLKSTLALYPQITENTQLTR
jgi:peptide/nickel transport system substrate-binding protein